MPLRPLISLNWDDGTPTPITVETPRRNTPGLRLEGKVDSIQRGTGAQFALLPPENATGNFVKVVQRVPVKITFGDPGEALRWISPACRWRQRFSRPSRRPG